MGVAERGPRVGLRSYAQTAAAVKKKFTPEAVAARRLRYDANARIAFAVEHAALASYLKRRAAIALQRGNALLECEARRAARNSLGGKIGAGLFVGDD